MKDLDSIDDFCKKAADDLLGEDDLFLLEIKVYVTLVKVLHDDVYFVFVLEGFSDGH